MPTLEYDPTAEALFFPARAPTLFRAGAALDAVQIGAECARMAYYRFKDGEFGRLADDLGEAGFSQAVRFSRGSTQAFGARRAADQLAVLAFRGTELTRWRT